MMKPAAAASRDNVSRVWSADAVAVVGGGVQYIIIHALLARWRHAHD
jgi:hypothetical protein